MNNIVNILKNGTKTDYLKRFSHRWKSDGFAMLPTKLLYDERLSRSCLMIYWVLITHLFRGKAYCFQSTQTIAKESRYSRPTVIKAIKELKLCGYLEIDG